MASRLEAAASPADARRPGGLASRRRRCVTSDYIKCKKKLLQNWQEHELTRQIYTLINLGLGRCAPMYWAPSQGESPCVSPSEPPPPSSSRWRPPPPPSPPASPTCSSWPPTAALASCHRKPWAPPTRRPCASWSRTRAEAASG